MNYEQKHKTFIKAFIKLTEHNKHHKQFKIDKRLTQTEKKIIESLIFLRRNDFSAGIETLTKVTPFNIFVDGIKELCLAHFYNNSGRLVLAKKHFKNSAQLFLKSNTPSFEFLSITGSIICHFNLKEQSKVKELFTQLQSFKLDNDSKKSNFLQCEALYQISSYENQLAIKTIDKVIQKYPASVKNRLGYFLTIKLIALFKTDDLDQFAQTLETYKNLSGFKIKENYSYMLSLLKYLQTDASLYVYQRDFSSVPYLYHQLNVIKSLSINELEQAKKSWDFLKADSQSIYKDNFEYNGDYCLFSKSLEKAKQSLNSNERTINQFELNKIKKIKDKILFILSAFNRPVSKEELISFLWQEQINEKNTIRLTTQISRLRKKSQTKIKVKNGNYYIDKAV